MAFDIVTKYDSIYFIEKYFKRNDPNLNFKDFPKTSEIFLFITYGRIRC